MTQTLAHTPLMHAGPVLQVSPRFNLHEPVPPLTTYELVGPQLHELVVASHGAFWHVQAGGRWLRGGTCCARLLGTAARDTLVVWRSNAGSLEAWHSECRMVQRVQ